MACVFQIFLKYSLQSYPTQKHRLTTPPPLPYSLSQPYSNHHSPLNDCTTLFNIGFNGKIIISVLLCLAWFPCFTSNAYIN